MHNSSQLATKAQAFKNSSIVLRGTPSSVYSTSREIPFSRKRGFSKTPLSQALEERGIHYVHVKELGSPGSVREELKSGHDYRKFFQAIEQYLATQTEGIERAYGYIDRMTCCLMCYERLAAMCHRKIVATKIKERDGNGLEVKHLKVD